MAYRCYKKGLSEIVGSTNVRVSEEWNPVTPKPEIEIEDTPIIVEEMDVMKDGEDSNEESR